MASAQEFEKILNQSDKSVASFETHHRSPLEKFQHFLHSSQAAVPLIVLLLSIIAFGILAGSKFFSTFALTLILQQVAIVGIVGAAQTLVILTAGIDLSVGAVMVLSSVVMGQFVFRYGIPVPIALLCGFLCGGLCGWINGVLVAKMKLPPFIVTLGTWQIYNATKYLYSRNETIRGQDIEAQAPLLQLFGNKLKCEGHLWQNFVCDYIPPIRWLFDGMAAIGAIFTLGVVTMVLLVCFLWYVLNYTAWGRRVYAVGDDPDAAELAGAVEQLQVDRRCRRGARRSGAHARGLRVDVVGCAVAERARRGRPLPGRARTGGDRVAGRHERSGATVLHG